MTIEKINFSYPKGTLQSVYDTESMTALELASKTSKKVDECVDLVNGVEQSAINASAIVDEMKLQQDQFITDNNDARTEVVNENNTFIDNMNTTLDTFKADTTAAKETYEDELNTSKTNFENDMNTTLDTFKADTTASKQAYEDGLNTSKNNFENDMNTTLDTFKADTTASKQAYEDGLNTSKTNFETTMNNNVNTIVANSNTTIQNDVNTKINTMVNDGSLSSLINDELLGGINTKVDTDNTNINAKVDTHITDANGHGIGDHIADKGNHFISVKDYGAKGDGITDDTNAIQSALAVGGITHFPKGTYKCNITIPSGAHIIGDSEKNTFLIPNVTTIATVTFDGTSTATIEHINFNCNGVVSGTGVEFKNEAISINFLNVWFDSLDTAVRCSFGYFIKFDTCRVIGCNTGFQLNTASNSITLINTSTLCNVRALMWLNSSGLTITGCTFEKNVEMVIQGSNGLSISGCYFEDDSQSNNYYMTIGSASGSQVSGVTISGNLFNRGATAGIFLVCCVGVEINGNSFYTSAHAIDMYSYDNSPKRGIHIGSNFYNINGAGYDPTKVINFLGGIVDNLNCNFADEHIQPILMYNQLNEPVGSSIPNSMGALYWDGTNIKFKYKDGNGSITIKTVTLA